MKEIQDPLLYNQIVDEEKQYILKNKSSLRISFPYVDSYDIEKFNEKRNNLPLFNKYVREKNFKFNNLDFEGLNVHNHKFRDCDKHSWIDNKGFVFKNSQDLLSSFDN